MPKRPDFLPVESENGWQVNVPAAMSAKGKRERKWFTDKKHAEAFAKTLRGKYARGERGITMDQAMMLDAREALAILQGIGITLTDAAKAAKAAHLASGLSEPFKDRYKQAMADGETRWRPPYYRDMEKLPDWVSAEFMKRECSTITKDGIMAELAAQGKYTQSTLQHRTRYISAILGWKPRHRKAKKIEILTETQCTAMLDAAKTKAERRVVALLLFAGIRPSIDQGEITKLDWSAVKEKEIYIAPEVAKTGTDRHIPITPRLAREIKGHPTAGTVLSSGWQKAYRRLRKAAETKAADVTRHTFASHFLAAYGEDKTKAAMGHTEGSRTLFRHYRLAVTEVAGRAFFGEVY